MKIITGLEHLYCEHRIRELRLFSLEEDWGRHHSNFQYLKGTYRRAGEERLQEFCSDKTKGKDFKLKDSRFRLDIRKKIFSVKVVKYWNRLPREIVSAPFLEVFKVRLDGALTSLV